MIYMVEMALIDTDRRADWDAWYLAHIQKLLTIPGFEASQRFETIHPAEAPFLALHQVIGPELFESDAYRNHGGPSGTGAWRQKMTNWHRNLLAGLDESPEVPMDGFLLIIEDGAESSVPAGLAVTWLEAVGLDSSVRRRGIAVSRDRSLINAALGKPGIRVLQPLTGRLTE